ncbi:hypothetical protein TDB9533_03528 [Thalassocella blandensis]|nr:hypothetical protein TDB9533_03528 [Thalassocella blandensis]
MYFTLINDNQLETDKYLNEPEDLPVELSFIRGDMITMDVQVPMVFSTNAKKGDELRHFLRSSVPIMSKQFVELLQGAGVDNLQVFPAEVKSEVDGYVWPDYYAVNVMGLISCANLEKSDYAEIMPGHYRFRELAIDADKAKDALLFRLQEHSPTIIIHESVCQYLVDNDPDDKLTGWSVGDIDQ